MTDDDATTLADISQRLADLVRTEHYPPWTVRQAPAGLPCYALLQRRFWAKVVVILSADAAVTYLTVRPTATEDPLTPTNTLVRVDGDAITCLKALGSRALRERPSHELTPDHFDAADIGLRAFVADVVAAVDGDQGGRVTADADRTGDPR